jgi:hypothetical protein
LFISAIFRALTPPPVPLTALLGTDKPLENTPQISFSDFTVAIPAKLGIYTVETDPLSVERFASQLANKLGYSPFGSTQRQWVSSDKMSSLSVVEDDQTIVLKNFTDPFELEEITNTTSQDQAKLIFTQFLDTQVGLHGYEITEENALLVSFEGVDVVSELSANAYGFTASQMIDGIPLVVGARLSPLATGIVLRNGKLLDISFYPQTRQVTKVFDKDTLPLSQIKRLASNGLLTFLIIVANDTNNLEATTNELKEITFTSGVLEYRENPENGFTIPYIHFTGTGKTRDDKVYNVQAISPAIRVQ